MEEYLEVFSVTRRAADERDRVSTMHDRMSDLVISRGLFGSIYLAFEKWVFSIPHRGAGEKSSIAEQIHCQGYVV